MTEINPKDETGAVTSLEKLLEKHQPESKAKNTSPKIPPNKPSSEHKSLLRVLMVIPWLLAIGFVYSLYWDFDGVGLTFFWSGTTG
jgi:hypothetical protein